MPADWNAVRFELDAGVEHVESYFLKLNDAGGQRALWLKATILASASRAPEAEAWSVAFDREAGHVGAKQVVPFTSATFSREKLDVRVAELELSAGRTRGSVVQGRDRIEWDLTFDASGEPLVPYPLPKMYSGPFPSQKMVTPYPDTRFSGSYRVNGREVRVERWSGMQGHNWGKRHTELYAWGHVSQWNDARDLVLEGATGRIKLGPILAPPLTLVCVWHEGRRYRFNDVKTLLKNRGAITLRSWRFEAENPDARVYGELAADTSEMVGLHYENPNGEMTYCLNSKIAWGLLVLEPRHGARVHATTRTAALEVGTKDPNHGIPMVA
ncbi:MAG: hypothetical protein U0263_38005 [Polyangiaceae bacterium]